MAQRTTLTVRRGVFSRTRSWVVGCCPAAHRILRCRSQILCPILKKAKIVRYNEVYLVYEPFWSKFELEVYKSVETRQVGEKKINDGFVFFTSPAFWNYSFAQGHLLSLSALLVTWSGLFNQCLYAVCIFLILLWWGSCAENQPVLVGWSSPDRSHQKAALAGNTSSPSHVGPHSWGPLVVGHYLSVPMGHWLALLVGSDGRGDIKWE